MIDEPLYGIGLVDPAIPQDVFHRLFDHIEWVNEQGERAGLSDHDLVELGHHELCNFFVGDARDPEREARIQQLQNFVPQRMYRVLLSYYVQALEGKLSAATRDVIGLLYYRDEYAKP